MQVPPFSLEKQLSEIGHELESAVLNVLRSGYYIGGEQVTSFENNFAASISVPYAVSCNSGTDALILALRALGVGPKDEVITVSFSFFATAEAISNVGAKPVFIDVDPSTCLIDLNAIQEAITPSTKAILPVHLFGRPVDMDKIIAIAKKNGLSVIEDCAQAAGAKWNGKSVGSWGDIGCFSFFPTKNLGTAGDGGLATTNNADLAQKMRELSVHGMPKRYFHTELGYNSRLDAIQAAILNVKLPKLKAWVEKRQEIALRYQELLENLPVIGLPMKDCNNKSFNSWNQFVIKVKNSKVEKVSSDKGFDSTSKKISNGFSGSLLRDWLKDRLQDRGVNTIIYYPIPIHLQPAYTKTGSRVCSLPHTENLSNEVLSLPIFPELTYEQQLYVVEQIKELLKELPS